MDRKKIYIIIIIICLAGTGGMLYWNSTIGDVSDIAPSGIKAPSADLDAAAPATGRTVNVTNIPTATSVITYPVPRTFPADAKLDLSIYNNSDFQALTDYTPLTVSPEEMGRENPFEKY